MGGVCEEGGMGEGVRIHLGGWFDAQTWHECDEGETQGGVVGALRGLTRIPKQLRSGAIA